MLGKEGGVYISVCVHVGRKDGLNKNDDEGKLRSTDSARTNKTNAHHRDCLSRQAAVFRIYASSFTLDVAVKRRFRWLAGWLSPRNEDEFVLILTVAKKSSRFTANIPVSFISAAFA